MLTNSNILKTIVNGEEMWSIDKSFKPIGHVKTVFDNGLCDYNYAMNIYAKGLKQVFPFIDGRQVSMCVNPWIMFNKRMSEELFFAMHEKTLDEKFHQFSNWAEKQNRQIVHAPEPALISNDNLIIKYLLEHLEYLVYEPKDNTQCMVRFDFSNSHWAKDNIKHIFSDIECSQK